MRLAIAATVALSLSSLAAYADTIDYTLTGDGNVDTFSLGQNPTLSPGIASANAYYFNTIPITVVENDTPISVAVQFAAPGNPIPVCFFGLTTVACDGSRGNVYFTGSPSDPTMLTGVFTFANVFDGNDTYTLTATDTTLTAVPEPCSLALLGTGVLGLANLARKGYRRA